MAVPVNPQNKRMKFGRFFRVGDMKYSMIPNDTDHEGFLLLGSAPRTLKRSMYPDLFAAIGTTFGAGDGSTTFILPTMEGLMAVGSGATLKVGQSGGAAKIKLTVDQLPPHTHSVPKAPDPLPVLLAVGIVNNASKAASGTVASGSAGSGADVNIMNPYTVMNWFVFAGKQVGT